MAQVKAFFGVSCTSLQKANSELIFTRTIWVETIAIPASHCHRESDEVCLANPRVYIHVDADGLIRDNLKGVGFRSQVSERAAVCTPSNIQDIIAWR